MIVPILGLAVLSFAVSWTATWAMRRIAPRIGFVDRPGTRKIHINPKPLGGGVAIVLGFALPIVAGLSFIELHGPPAHLAGTALANSGSQAVNASKSNRLIAAYWSGARDRAPLVVGVLLGVGLMHLMGLLDDRRAMGPYSKLLIQLGVIIAMVSVLDLRALSMLDHLGLGKFPSIVLTVLWIATVTNAFNFLDNMDGLSAGVGAVATAAFLVTTLSIQQWFVAAGLSLLLGSLLGFLFFNFNPASIFMGDSGSLVIGLVLGILTVRTTYIEPGEELGAGWYAVFAPLIVLAVPVYDLLVVSTLRLSRGKSPFVGDTNHLSHRLVARGMSRRNAVLCIYLITAATAVAAVILPHVHSTFVAMAIFAQTLLILGVVAVLEQHPLHPQADTTVIAIQAPSVHPAAARPQTSALPTARL